MPFSRESVGMLLGLGGVLMFAGTLPATRVAVTNLDPLFITFSRAALPGLISAALFIGLRRRFPPRQQWLAVIIASLTLVFGFPLFSAIAMTTVPAAHGGVVLGMLPIATALAATMLAGERPSAGFWIAALAGSAIVIAFALREGGGAFVSGDFWLLASVAVAAIGYTYSGKLASRMPGWEVIGWALVIALPVSLLGAWLSWPPHATDVARNAWFAVLYVALFAQFIGFFFWNAGLAMGGIARVGQMQLLQPFAIVLIEWV
jgi:drug/metabolite transporter (DMT)-like permease